MCEHGPVGPSDGGQNKTAHTLSLDDKDNPVAAELCFTTGINTMRCDVNWKTLSEMNPLPAHNDENVEPRDEKREHIYMFISDEHLLGKSRFH